MDDEIAAQLLDDHADREVTLTMLGMSDGGEAKWQWLDTTIFADLRTAVQAIIEDNGERGPYTLVVHAPDGDIPITESEGGTLVDFVRKNPA